MLGFPPRNNPQTVLGIDPRQARNLLSSLRHAAGGIERLHGFNWLPGTFRKYESYLKHRANRAISDDFPQFQEEWLNNYAKYMRKTPRDFHEGILLPCLMRDFAGALEGDLKTLQSLRKHPLRSAALSQLIYHVKKETGRYRDDDVSALVNAAENRSNDKPYTAHAHKRWRERNERLIARLGPLHVYPAILPPAIR